MSLANNDLLAWYDLNKRDLPWRNTTDIYAVWLSEVMLQQTRITTVLPYYYRWMLKFPTLESLADANESEILAMWQGLGYYSRCRNFQAGARFVLANGMPTNSEEWQKVPGVGPYTAAAISSICYGEAIGSVDGNFLRVCSRFCAKQSSRSELLANASEWAFKHICTSKPGDWNQAIMELGATVCSPRNPKCTSCPLKADCKGQATPELYPARTRDRQIVHLSWLVTVFCDGASVGLEQIPNGKWWQGMWKLPTVECHNSHQLHKTIGFVNGTVTHHKIRFEIELRREAIPNELLGVPIERLSEFAIPAPYRKAIELTLNQKLACGSTPQQV